jgi:hypothetical protein
MIWILSLGCAIGVQCILTHDWTSRYLYHSEQECLQAGKAILEKARSKEAKKFEVKCEGREL